METTFALTEIKTIEGKHLAISLKPKNYMAWVLHCHADRKQRFNETRTFKQFYYDLTICLIN